MGGFGITYIAEQTGLGRKVAVKEFFMQELCNRDSCGFHVSVGSVGSRKLVERFRQKFLKEARMIASFDNENIIKIFDVFEENGTAYYVMEYLEGKSLKAMVEESGVLVEATAVKYIRQVADALREIHSHHLLHLDVKPANIMLNRKGQAVLIDFGISKHYDEGGHQTSSALVGISEGYAPIEQYEAGALDCFTPATDIYALGATLFFLLTGTRPPKAGDVMNDGLPVLPQEISPAVRNAVEKAMLSRRKDRPQNIDAFVALLDEVGFVAVLPVNDEETVMKKLAGDGVKVEGQTINNYITLPPKEARTPKKQGKGKSKWLLFLILLLAVIAGFAWYITNSSVEFGKNPSSKAENQGVGNVQPNPNDTIKVTFVTPFDDTDTIKVDDSVLQMCSLTLTTIPADATVKIDGNVIGKTPLADYEIEKGEYTISITKEGYKKYEKIIDLNNATKNIGVNLEKLTSKLTIKTNPADAIVKIDGKVIGKTPLVDCEIEKGEYTINITKEGYKKYEKTIDLNNATKNIGVNLEKLTTKLTIKANPADAIVKIDSKVIDKTLLSGYEIEQGKHTINIIKVGYVEYEDTIELNSATKDIVVNLEKYDYVGEFSDGLAKVKLDGKLGFIDKSGKVFIPLIFDYVGDFFDGWARVKFDGKWGFYNKSGKTMIPCKFDYVGDFSDGWARVKCDGKWGFIGNSGKDIIPWIFDYVEDFSDGQARAVYEGENCHISQDGTITITRRRAVYK